VDTVPLVFVHVGESDTLKTCSMSLAGVTAGLPTRGDESHLELFVEPLGPDEAREADRAGGPGGNAAFDELTTCDVRHEPGSFISSNE
jgi:hypothetical protein